jgi:hypothetical protein
MSVFKTQSLITLRLATGIDLSSATTTRILYKKPLGTKGYFSASVDGQTLEYEIQDSDIDQAGIWEFQSYIEVGGRKGFGDIAKQHFEDNISA